MTGAARTEVRPSPVSVVIVTRNRCRSLLATVERLSHLPEAPPIIVVDNGSTDGTVEALRAAFPQVSVLAWPDNIGAAGRNLGVALASTPYVAFCDDDSWWEAGALERASTILDADPRIGLIAGRVIVEPAGKVDPTCHLMARSPIPPPAGFEGVPVLGFLACASVIRRQAFWEVGGFHRRLGVGGEEHLMALDLAGGGWLQSYAATVVAHHQPHARNTDERTWQMRRNELWSAWLRYRLRDAVRTTWRCAREALTDRSSRKALAVALAGVLWVLRERRTVTPSVQAMVRLCADDRSAAI
jgi:GT2 family glycosyltransferase